MDRRFDLNAAFAFEAVQIAADAIKRANSNEPAAIHAALKATDIKDHIIYGGPIRFNEKGQNPNIGVVMLQNQNGRPVVHHSRLTQKTRPRPFNRSYRSTSGDR